jgi:hypothetical protein
MADDAAYRVFISLCLSDDSDSAAVKLRNALEAAGISCFLCNSLLGDDLADDIARALDACEVFVVLGTEGYGKQGLSRFSTKQELEFAVSHGKPICLIKRCDAFADPVTRMYLPASMLHQLWYPHTDMPAGLVADISAKLEAAAARAAAEESDPAVWQQRCVNDAAPGALACIGWPAHLMP